MQVAETVFVQRQKTTQAVILIVGPVEMKFVRHSMNLTPYVIKIVGLAGTLVV